MDTTNASPPFFRDRLEAGRALGEKLAAEFKNPKEVILLALPRGGVPVAFEAARRLGAMWDLLMVRKIGHPMHSEYGVGAITEDGLLWINPGARGLSGLPAAMLNSVIERETFELERRVRRYREGVPLPSLKDKTVIIVDDGLATGVTAKAASLYARERGVGRLVLAVPVGAFAAVEGAREAFDEVICLHELTGFTAVSAGYKDFSQTTDAEVLELRGIKKASVVRPQRPMTPRISSAAEQDGLPLRGREDAAFIVDRLASARVVMLGESSHGTHEFYEWRRWISMELIKNHGFRFIAVEGDWPACGDVNDFIHDRRSKHGVYEALRGFQRWPTWMWANQEVARLVEELKIYNARAGTPAGFYGLDVYSLFESIDQVLWRLAKIDPKLAEHARLYYSCFDPANRDEKLYARSLIRNPAGCEAEVVGALQSVLEQKVATAARRSKLFDVQQNARIVKNAERYYRAMVFGEENSWNIRDEHMLETLDLLLKKYGPQSKGIVWAHNTHIGDYRYTPMKQQGDINLGGLAREKWGEDQVNLLGFGTHHGSVIAGSAWGSETQEMGVPGAPMGTYEAILHDRAQRLQSNAFFLWLKGNLRDSDWQEVRGHRAIGVVYNPAHEMRGNYVPTSLSKRYDGFVFVDATNALVPLRIKPRTDEIPETWPAGV